MLTLSDVAKLEKNKLNSDGAWILLLEVQVAGLPDIIRVCRNNDDVTWNGFGWVAFPFELGDISEDTKGTIPSVELKVSNVTKALQYYLEQANGGVQSKVILRVVHSKHLDLTSPELEEVFSVTKVSADAMWVTFTLGMNYPNGARRPLRRYLKNFCPFKYKQIECGSNSSYQSCDKTLTACRERGNSTRFGGEEGIPSGGMYI